MDLFFSDFADIQWRGQATGVEIVEAQIGFDSERQRVKFNSTVVFGKTFVEFAFQCEKFGKPMMRRRVSWAYENRAKAFLKNGNTEKAIEDFNKILSLDPYNEKIYMRLGDIL